MPRTKSTAKKAVSAAKTAKAAAPVKAESPAPVVEAANVVIDETPEFVTVALNHPFGLKFRVLDKYGVEHVIEIAGNATGLKGLEKGVLPGAGAYGITPGVPAELWDAVKAKYQHMAVFRNGLIFATGDTRSAKKEAKNRESIRSGFEPVEPDRAATEEE